MPPPPGHGMAATRLLILPLLIGLLGIAGCGGGGGSSGGSGNTPTANPTALTTQEDTPASGNLNAVDPDGDPLNYKLVYSASAGTVTITDPTTGAFTYTPAANYNGTDSFSYQASDGTADSNIATVTITVTPVNDPPVANDDAYTLAEDGTLTVTAQNGLLANDSDADADTLAAAVVTGPGHGSLNLATDGSFTYTPDANYNGTDSFSYQANDGTTNSDTGATVTITITAVNDPPAANNDAYSVAEDGTLTVALLSGVLANDSDAEGDALSASLVSATNHGALSFAADGSFGYTPDANYNGTDSFSYRASDGSVDSNIATVTITVTSVNDPPVANAGADQYVAETTLVDLSGSGSSDIDDGIASYQWTQVAGPAVTLSGANTVTASFTAPNVGGQTVFTFRLTVTDYSGASHQDDVNVTVSDIFLSDDFSDGNSTGWAIVDNGKTSLWDASTFQFREINETGDALDLDQSYHLGSYAYLSGGGFLALTDYRFSVDITAQSAIGRDVGIMFRYQDDNNYYRLSFSGKMGFARLEKKVGGVFSTLALDARGYRPGESLQLTVDLKGGHILTYRNGEPLFSVNDADLATGSVALYTCDAVTFDNVLVQESTAAPSVVIATPAAYSVEPGDSLAVSAIANNVPSGESVTLTLDGAACGTVSESVPGVFETTCAGPIAQGDHTLSAAITGTNTGDTNPKVGVLGDYYVAVGDSITNGTGNGDNYAADNLSQDGRIVAFGGYEANLSDLLTTSQPYPHIIFNEGVPADNTFDTLTRIDSMLLRHSQAQTLLLLLGTNDSGGGTPTPSGLGCSGAACDGTYKGNMQALVDAITATGKSVRVALVPPAWGTTYNSTPYADPLAAGTRNADYIQDYNQVIQTELTGALPGPDLFAFFLGAGTNRFSLFADNFHPNGLGTVVLAQLWHNALTGASAMPFILDNLSPSTTAPYLKQNLLEVGDTYYVDEAFTLTGIPAALANGRWVMTANADRTDTSASNYLSFDVDRPVTVYVAYDAAATTLPAWLQNNFTDTGLQVAGTDPATPLLRLYQQSYTAGTVALGGNAANGADGASSYLVCVVEN